MIFPLDEYNELENRDYLYSRCLEEMKKIYKAPVAKNVLLYGEELMQLVVGSEESSDMETKQQGGHTGSIWNTWTSDDDK